jgi:DNA-binding PadR family transcriptional regulator
MIPRYQVTLLVAISKRPGIIGTSLRKMFDTSGIYVLLARMEKAGLITREEELRNGRICKKTFLTSKGARVLSGLYQSGLI